MGLLGESVSALGRNLRIATFYLASLVLLGLAHQCVLVPTRELFEPDPPLPFWVLFLGLFLDLASIAGSALIQCIAFAFLSKDLDRPLWKLDKSVEALRRFFALWFVISLVSLTLIRFLDAAPRGGSLFSLCVLLLTLWFIVSLPIGAAVMFAGRVAWGELAGDLKPLLRQFHLVPPALFVMFIEFGVFLSIPDWFHLDAKTWWSDFVLFPLSNLPLGIMDLIVFAWVFLVCKHDRDTRSEGSDFDF